MGPAAARILVVDDSLVIRKAIEKKLQHQFDLILAADGEAGWDALLQDDVRVLVTDIEMPRLDGCAFISRIRASTEPRIRDLPIIAMTGAEDEETKERVLASGATDFLVKPIDPLQLLARVHALARLDLTTRRLAESQAALQDQSTLDPLTGLSSRRYFQQSCQQNLAYAVRHGQGLSLVRMEIDGFKSLYQQLGDARVDQILVWLAGIFAATCRREDTVARIGGTHFAVVAPATDREKTRALCRRLREAVLSRPFVSGGAEISVTLSIGAVTLDEGVARNYEDMMEVAERRVRQARIAGGDRVVVAEAVEELTPSEPVESPDTPSLSLPEVEELSGDGLELLEFTQDALSIETEGAPVAWDVPSATDGPACAGIDAALQKLATGEGASIEPWLDHLARQLLPLLEFYSERREGALDAAIARIRARNTDPE